MDLYGALMVDVDTYLNGIDIEAIRGVTQLNNEQRDNLIGKTYEQEILPTLKGIKYLKAPRI